MNDDKFSDDEIKTTMRSFSRKVIAYETMQRLTRYALGAAIAVFIMKVGFVGFGAAMMITACGLIYAALNMWYDFCQLTDASSNSEDN